MLVYVATYPRCGSGVLRNLLWDNFRLPTASGYPGAMFGAPAGEPGMVIHKGRKMLVSDCLPLLTPDFRRRLGAEPDAYFVKTHEGPPESPWEGERAIQLVRHPGAAIVSHQRLESATRPEYLFPLDAYVDGQRFAGSWSDYHEAWGRTHMPVLRARYEDVVGEPAPFVRDMARFLGLPAPAEVRAEPLEAARSRNPVRNPGMGPDGWREVITGPLLDRLWELHGETARRFGYA